MSHTLTCTAGLGRGSAHYSACQLRAAANVYGLVSTCEPYFASTNEPYSVTFRGSGRNGMRQQHLVQDNKLNISIPLRLVVFGGRGADRKRLNDVHFLDVSTWTWHRPTTDGMPPTPRLGAAAVFMEGQMIIFGGYGSGARLNDLHVLDLSSWQWQQPAFTGTAPSPRQSPGMALQGQLQAVCPRQLATPCSANPDVKTPSASF